MNYWIEMDNAVKFPILDKAVEYGYLKKEFVEDIKKVETDEDNT